MRDTLDMNLDAAELLAARRYYDPLAELTVSAGFEFDQHAATPVAPMPPLLRMCAAQNDVVDEVAHYFWREMARLTVAAEDPVTLAGLASHLDRAAAVSKVAHFVKTMLAGIGGPISSAPVIPWADYLTSTALVHVLLLIDAGHLSLNGPRGGGAAELRKMRRRHLSLVPGCFWDAGGDDPIMGIAGWVCWHAEVPCLLVAAMVASDSAALHRTRWQSLCQLAQCGVPPFDHAKRLRGPFEVVGVC